MIFSQSVVVWVMVVKQGTGKRKRENGMTQTTKQIHTHNIMCTIPYVKTRNNIALSKHSF